MEKIVETDTIDRPRKVLSSQRLYWNNDKSHSQCELARPVLLLLVDGRNHRTLENLKKEIDGNGNNILIIVSEIETLTNEDRTIKDLKKDFPEQIEELEEASYNYIAEIDLEFFKTEFPDKWKYFSKKLAYRYEFCDCPDDYRKPVNNFKKEDCFSGLKRDYPIVEERTKKL